MRESLPYFDPAVTNTVEMVQASRVSISNLNVENEGAAKAYLQFFDVDDVGDVVLGTTTPVLSVPLPATSVWNPDLSIPLTFIRGCAIAATAGRTNNVAPAGTIAVNLLKVLR